MTEQVSKSHFRARVLEFLRQVETTGKLVVITDHGQPRLELRRYSAPQQNPLKILRGTVLRYDAPMEPVGDDDREAVS